MQFVLSVKQLISKLLLPVLKYSAQIRLLGKLEMIQRITIHQVWQREIDRYENVTFISD